MSTALADLITYRTGLIVDHGPGRADRSGHGSPPDDAAAPITVTVTVKLSTDAGQDRLVRALRDLVSIGEADVSLSVPEPASPPPRYHQHARLLIHPWPRTVTRDGVDVPLSRLEYDLLVFLAENPRRVYTRSQLLAHVWGERYASTRTVDVHVRRLRAKLGEDIPLISTVRWVGYRLAEGAPVRIVYPTTDPKAVSGRSR
mgnify:CR=1 FL=1